MQIKKLNFSLNTILKKIQAWKCKRLSPRYSLSSSFGLKTTPRRLLQNRKLTTTTHLDDHYNCSCLFHTVWFYFFCRKYRFIQIKSKRLHTLFFQSWFPATAKELSHCHKLWYFMPFIFTTQCCQPQVFQAMNSDWSNNQSLKYLRFTPSSFRDIGIMNIEICGKDSIFLC